MSEGLHYDYIISGAGCAGLSLLRRMMQHPFFDTKKILLLDKASKNVNDRTWCFWEQQPGFFEDIIYHKWQQIDFFTDNFSVRYDLEPYQYKMIRGIDLYNVVLTEARNKPNVTILNDEVVGIESQENCATIQTITGKYSAAFIFNSIILENWQATALQQKKFVLLQHFKGWEIETGAPFFNVNIATFMDFRMPQNYPASFVYVLPSTAKKALVEYTVFSDKILNDETYNSELETYINNILKLKNYTILNTEFGIIPMTDYSFSKGSGRIINIGTAGGKTKASSGYTFQFIQKHADKIIDALVNNKNPLLQLPLAERRFAFYDSVLLNVLSSGKMRGERIFSQMFKHNVVQQVLKFLDNETTLAEDFKIMNSVSLTKFLPAALNEVSRFFIK